ncbi:MAG: Gfo/Idh/MocA family oxidoreductase [Lachnospiraceae bacterium]|nr:Gfo/Idh/MocA family oxidoreductase [Lachnospiraceae bacterium]
MRMGILSASDIAKRRFIPALLKCRAFDLAGIGFADNDERGAVPGIGGEANDGKRAATMELCGQYGVRFYESYHDLLSDKDIDAVYISLPPALHHHWCMEALGAGKHVLVEKPVATTRKDCWEMTALAGEKHLAVVENYGFLYHKQMNMIKKLILGGEIGHVRLIRAAFGFPKRSEDDFRYSRVMGGGALLDCGGYTLRLAGELLGAGMEVRDTVLMPLEGHDVDGHGYITALNPGVTDHSPENVLTSDAEGAVFLEPAAAASGVACEALAQLAFGMDNQYKCELEIWGSEGTVFTDRIFTAPPEYETKLTLIKGLNRKEIVTGADDQFLRIIEKFEECIKEPDRRSEMYGGILRHNSNLMRAMSLGKDQ